MDDTIPIYKKLKEYLSLFGHIKEHILNSTAMQPGQTKIFSDLCADYYKFIREIPDNVRSILMVSMMVDEIQEIVDLFTFSVLDRDGITQVIEKKEEIEKKDKPK